ncbi:MAG TPA: nucleotide exchange factor GrpE [Vicinamibacterales bacterium]|nr:nucleotide exchange factor GrpE [Vicinamibacterales bacterium]
MSEDFTRDLGDATAAALEDELAALRRERDDLRDRLLRASAEFDNYRKRTDRERRELSEAAAIDLIRDVLPVIDDFERALAVPGWEPGTRRGIELIHRQLLDTLRRRGVEPLEVLGLPFDPTWHEAIAADPANGRPDGEITAEVRRGYRLGQRLLRPAQVKVARA